MKEIISLHIDGKRIFADKGTTIMEAARYNGIEIPSLCYHPRLEPLGHCRLCIVKVDGIERPITSCDNPVAEGMIVTTSTPELEDMRSQIIELSLATHPYKDCLTCVRTGTCELQEKAYQYQVDLPEQLDRTVPSEAPVDNPYIVRDEEKCILCGRCIQVCRRGPGRSVYSMIGNGVNTRVVPFRNGMEVSLEEAGCIFCGQCVDVCPVAALTERGRSEGGREWELTNVPGICIECSLGCYLERQVSGDDLIKVTVPVEGDRVSWLCKKGKFGFRKENSGIKPIATTMKRVKGSYSEATYEDAIRETAEKLLNLKQKYGSTALAVLSSGQLSNEENYLLHKFCATILETPNLELGAEPGWLMAVNRMQAVTGTGIIGPTPAAIRKAEVIFIIGSGLEESHPVAAMAVGQAGRFGDAVIIRTDPVPEDSAAWDSISLKTKNNSYASLLETMSMLIESKEEANDALKKIGVNADQIRRAAKLLSANKSYTIVCPSLLEKADHDLIETLISMARVCGQVVQGRSRLLLLSRYSNAFGVLAAGGTTMNREEIISAVEAGKIKGLLLFGGSFADFKTSGLNFLAAQSFSEDEAPGGAEILFPAQPIIYKNGLFTNSAGQIRFNQSLPGQGSSLHQDWLLICDLAKAMGARWHYTSLDDVREEMKGLITI